MFVLLIAFYFVSCYPLDMGFVLKFYTVIFYLVIAVFVFKLFTDQHFASHLFYSHASVDNDLSPAY